MKRNLILAGCLVMLAGILARAQNTSTTTPFMVTITCPAGTASTLCGTFPASWVTVTPQPTTTAGTSSGEFTGPAHGAWQDNPLPLWSGGEGAQLPMVAPTMRDVVTHKQELGCSKGYQYAELLLGVKYGSSSTDEATLPVCVTPAFIAELKKANGELK